MSEQSSQTNEAREASMSRVQTQETILANLKPQEAASVPAGEETPPAQETQEGEHPKGKKSPQERIREAIDRRNKAEREASEARREAAELRARMEAMEARATPMQEPEKPDRAKFPDDEQYIEALADWKARKAIAAREREQVQARMNAEAQEIASNWSKRQEQAIKEIPDYAEVLGAADIQIANHVQQAIVESEIGPQLAYYLALNPDEVKRLNAMRPVAALRHMVELEKELREDTPEATPKEEPAKPPKSKAPEPISPVKEAPAANPGKAESFEEYRRRRKAQQGKS